METRRAGSASGLGKRTDGNIGTAPQADSTTVLCLDEIEQDGDCRSDLSALSGCRQTAVATRTTSSPHRSLQGI